MSKSATRGKIIVSGILFWYPLAGVTYQFLHYLLGLRRLGYDPYYIEDSGRWVYDPRLNTTSGDASGNVAMVAPILEAYGFAERWAYRNPYVAGQCYGLSEARIRELYKEADALLNVTGAQEIREEQMACPRRIYIESDPFAIQVLADQGDPAKIAMLDAHDTLFTFGENVGQADCAVPTGHYNWLPTRQPVALDLWDNKGGGGTTYNTITTWHNSGKNVSYDGDVYYWTKDREFEKYLDLPRRALLSTPPPSASASSQRATHPQFELAVQLSEDARPAVQRLLADHGWQVADAVHISNDMGRYRGYIQQSRAEFTVARDQYTRPRTGWFSDRSACYLAAGRPVITQETGFSKYLPTGKGLFAFSTLEDILAAIDVIESDYARNCRAARAIAEEYFAAEKVIGSLMQRAGL